MFYYNSVSKERRNSATVPDEGIYVYNNGRAFTEIKFLAEFEDFDMVAFRVSGKNQGSYIITRERVEML
jgi:hypothetical protein